MVCFTLLYMDNLWLVGYKGKKLTLRGMYRTKAQNLCRAAQKKLQGVWQVIGQ